MKKLTYSGLTLVLAIAILAGTAGTVEAKSTKVHASTTIPFKMKLQVALSGKAHLTGKVESVSGDSFKLSSWGGTWTVKTGSSTKFSNKGSVSLIKVGDYVQVHGKVLNAQAMTLEAQHINNKSFKKDTKNLDKKIEKKLGKLFKGHKDDDKLYASSTDALKVATVQSVSTSTNSLSVKLQNGVSYLVNTSGLTRYFNRALNPINFSDIKAGHNIAAYGTTTTAGSTTTLNATIIHDLSL
ncbi:MAG: DUF5666 domain-containing protein [bacterium]|nr:DUF5666 domain-containing protein [bacterium]